jgi:hypothetical protein
MTGSGAEFSLGNHPPSRKTRVSRQISPAINNLAVEIKRPTMYFRVSTGQCPTVIYVFQVTLFRVFGQDSRR